jgi:hypothetical protein
MEFENTEVGELAESEQDANDREAEESCWLTGYIVAACRSWSNIHAMTVEDKRAIVAILNRYQE